MFGKYPLLFIPQGTNVKVSGFSMYRRNPFHGVQKLPQHINAGRQSHPGTHGSHQKRRKEIRTAERFPTRGRLPGSRLQAGFLSQAHKASDTKHSYQGPRQMELLQQSSFAIYATAVFLINMHSYIFLFLHIFSVMHYSDFFFSY